MKMLSLDLHEMNVGLCTQQEYSAVRDGGR